VGAPSAKNLIRKDFRITAERGKLFKSELARAILATLHPAYILRQQSQTNDGGYGLLVADIAKAWSTAVRLAERQPSGSPAPASQFELKTCPPMAPARGRTLAFPTSQSDPAKLNRT